ncbi:MAG: ABC transporter ATP-binding protein [Motiliproteus sp.]
MLSVNIEQKDFGSATLFDDFQMSLASGELLCLLGPSGCGKTTLLNMIAGIDNDYQGAIEQSQNYRISYMFQEPRLLPWRTVQQNLELVVKGCQATAADPSLREGLDTKINHLLKQMGLQNCLDLYPAQLSLGMARRVALARCLLIEPQLILMDEPFVSLDETNLKILYQQLQLLREKHPKLSILLVTHDIREALRLADRILIFDRLPIRQNKEYRPALAPALRTPEDIQKMEEELRTLNTCDKAPPLSTNPSIQICPTEKQLA